MKFKFQDPNGLRKRKVRYSFNILTIGPTKEPSGTNVTAAWWLIHFHNKPTTLPQITFKCEKVHVMWKPILSTKHVSLLMPGNTDHMILSTQHRYFTLVAIRHRSCESPLFPLNIAISLLMPSTDRNTLIIS